MGTALYRIPAGEPAPEGYQVFGRSAVAGLTYRKGAVRSFVFASASQKWIELALEPRNDHDPNAIKIIGCAPGWLWGVNRWHIGYVEAEIAAELAEKCLAAGAIARMANIYVGSDDYFDLQIQILVPVPRCPACGQEITRRHKKCPACGVRFE